MVIVTKRVIIALLVFFAAYHLVDYAWKWIGVE